mgnify:CR=1 FL=1
MDRPKPGCARKKLFRNEFIFRGWSHATSHGPRSSQPDDVRSPPSADSPGMGWFSFLNFRRVGFHPNREGSAADSWSLIARPRHGRRPRRTTRPCSRSSRRASRTANSTSSRSACASAARMRSSLRTGSASGSCTSFCGGSASSAAASGSRRRSERCRLLEGPSCEFCVARKVGAGPC